MGTVFTLVAAVALGTLTGAAPLIGAAGAAAFNGLSATGFLTTDTAGFFELGIRPRTTRMDKQDHRRHEPDAGTDTKTEKRGNEFLNRQDVGRSFGVQSWRYVDPFPFGKCIAHGVGPEVLLSLLPDFAAGEATHYRQKPLFQEIRAYFVPVTCRLTTV
ncbi:hypothetical protein ACSFA3_07610 [Variovorax sp. RHLX14]|uniref:hypothetical protein n=1 Tax=Variovorax sp. RHLX14 TaxID=1259731 RepID=UPI003F447E2D